MQVEYLLYIRFLVGSVCIASPEEAVVGYYHHLKHMVVERQRHLVKRSHILVKRWYREHVGTEAKIRD